MIIIERFNGIQRFDIADVLFDRSTENNIMTHVPLRIFFQMANCHFAIITSSDMVIDMDCYRGDNIYSIREKFLQLWKVHASLKIVIYGNITKTVPSNIRIFNTYVIT